MPRPGPTPVCRVTFRVLVKNTWNFPETFSYRNGDPGKGTVSLRIDPFSKQSISFIADNENPYIDTAPAVYYYY